MTKRWTTFGGLWRVGAMFAALTVAATAPAAVAETDIAAFGPEIGAPAPHPLALSDHTGAARSLEGVLAEAGASNGVVVYFNRSLDWCSICKVQAMGVERRLDDFTQRGYGVVTVTTDTPEELAPFVEDREARGIYLADPEREAIQAFNVVDPVFADRKPGRRTYKLPFPSAIVIDAQGRVAASLLEGEGYGEKRGFRERITVDLMLETLDGLAKAS